MKLVRSIEMGAPGKAGWKKVTMLRGYDTYLVGCLGVEDLDNKYTLVSEHATRREAFDRFVVLCED